MGLLSIFQRGKGGASAAVETGDPVQAARARARHRLIGAVVLVVAGVIGFPLVFETQPRPIPVDIPIEIPRREGAPALTMPAPRPVAKAAVPVASGNVVAAPRDDVITESKTDAGKEVPPASAPAAVVSATPAAPAKVPSLAAAEPAKKPVEARPAPAVADAKRAKALLEGKPPVPVPAAKPDTKESGRFVVQVGAFADTSAARDTRVKAEKLGLKTYMQVVETSAGHRTRVRIGPFATRDEADKALARAKDAGLNAVVLTL
jgi:DedD protein